MIGLEREISSALREQAEGDVDVATLLAGARARGGRLARRRRRLGGLAAGVTALALVAGFVLAVDRPVDRDPSPVAAGQTGASGAPPSAPPSSPSSGSAGPAGPGGAGAARAGALSLGDPPTGEPRASSFASLPHPPLLPAAVPASKDAAVVGDQQSQLHLDLTVLPGPVQLAQWTVLPGWERLIVQSVKAGQIDAEISLDSGQLPSITGPTHAAKVGGLLATVAAWQKADELTTQVRWQPEPGIWGQLSIDGSEQTALAVAAGLQLTQVYRCAVPFRLATDVTKLGELGCGLVFAPDGDSAMATVGTAKWSVTVTAAPGSVASDTSLGGWPAKIFKGGGDGGGRTLQVGLAVHGHAVDFTGSGDYDQTVILQLASRYREVQSLDQPDRWTGGPLG